MKPTRVRLWIKGHKLDDMKVRRICYVAVKVAIGCCGIIWLGHFIGLATFYVTLRFFFRGHSIFIILNEVEIDKNSFHSKKCQHKFLWSIKNSSNCCKLSVKRCFHPRYNDRILMYWIFMSFFSSFYLKKPISSQLSFLYTFWIHFISLPKGIM